MSLFFQNIEESSPTVCNAFDLDHDCPEPMTVENNSSIDPNNSSIDPFSSGVFDELKCIIDNVDLHKCNIKTTVYYSYELKTCGKRYLIAQMCGNVSDCFERIGTEEVDYQINLSRFVSTLTIRQQRLFAIVLNKFKNVYLTQSNAYSPVCEVPKQLADLRRMYTEGENSIENHLPIPDCVMLVNHSYVSIRDCIADVLLRSKMKIASINDDWPELSDNESANDSYNIFRCNRILEIVKNGYCRIAETDSDVPLTVLPIFLSLWSDDFDPNRSIKANRQSVWIKTCTIFFMNTFGKYIEKTFPIAMSIKGTNHEEVESEIAVELKLLNSGNLVKFYSCAHGQPVHVHADIFCILNDQHERRGNLRLSNGNSIAHGRFGITLDCRQRKDVIKSCEDCTNSISLEVKDVVARIGLSNYEWRNGSCTKCTAWMYCVNNDLLDYRPDKDYPSSMTQDQGTIKPQHITKQSLEASITYVHNQIQNGLINNAKARSVLKYKGWNSEAQDAIIDCANNMKKLTRTFFNRRTDPDAYAIVLEESKDDPTKFKKYSLPSSWYHFSDLRVHVDVPMHLLMLGVVKSVMLRIGVWLRFRSQKTLFLSMARKKLMTIKSMNIEWCKILEFPVTDKFGGWVSENFLAMTRLSNWFYSLIHFLPESKNYVDPTTPHNKWTKKENEGWLEARGLSKAGKAGDLRNRVAKFFSDNNVPPIIVKNDCTKDNILEMIRAMSLMIHLLMSYDKEKYQIGNFEATIRYFLITYDVVDKGLSDKEVPSWISQYNFLCLLNLPETIQNYGHMRNLWEGGTNGEGYLKRVKNVLKPGLINQWQKWSIINLLKDDLYSEWNDSSKSEEDLILLHIRKECKIYSNRKHALMEIDSGKPFSAVALTNSKTYVCYRHAQKIRGIPVLQASETCLWNGIQYHSITIRKGYIEIDCTRDLVGLIFLPKVTTTDYESRSESTDYCFVRSDWT